MPFTAFAAEVLVTLLGAGLGAVLRYALGGWINHRLGPQFPWGTLAVNVAGCFALGLLEGAAPREEVLLFVLGRGVLAGFTTFSTLMLETLNLALAGEYDRAFFNVVGSLSLGLAALLFGAYLGAEVVGSREHIEAALQRVREVVKRGLDHLDRGRTVRAGAIGAYSLNVE